MAYYIYMDKVLLPIAPSELSLKIGGNNSSFTLINDGEINILKKPKLTEISFDALLPNVKYPFATYKDGYKGASYFLEKLEKLKSESKSFQFIITRTMPSGKMLFDTDITVSLESYEIQENTDQGFDVVVSIKLKQYKPYGTKTCNITFASTKPKIVPPPAPRPVSNNNPAPKSNNKTYTVVQGDCLWNISKKFYGKGAEYMRIYNANKDKIKDPHWIYPGQVFVIPM